VPSPQDTATARQPEFPDIVERCGGIAFALS
jgi:hypothetical protein